MRRLEDLSADELAERFPPRRPPPPSVPRATPPTVVPRLREGAAPAVRAPRGQQVRPPTLHLVSMRCPSCRRPWVDTTLRLPCPFCGASA